VKADQQPQRTAPAKNSRPSLPMVECRMSGERRMRRAAHPFLFDEAPGACQWVVTRGSCPCYRL
jgi:hypothetical protein